MPVLFDNAPDRILDLQDFGDHTRCVHIDGQIRRRFEGARHRQRAEEYVAAFTEGYEFHKEQTEPVSP